MTANPLDPAMDKMSVAPGPDDADPATPVANAEAHPRDGADRPAPSASADAGTDASIAERLARDPESKEARLDCALDESMDASDPPASTQPIHNNNVPDSSGYDPEAERERQGPIGTVLDKIGLK